MSQGLTSLSAIAQRKLLADGEVSARELLASHRERVEEVNPKINAVVAIDWEVAERSAAAVDDVIAAGGDPGPLGGLVTAHKDLLDTADFVTTYGSPLLAGDMPANDSLLVSRMKEAGAVAIGKTNTPEFGAGSHTFNPVYGVTRNPFNHDLSAGGSSGGAAAALATNMVAIADGSDAGGSLRNPAAWNNVVGFRTSPRVVPRIGTETSWSTIPIDGPMARNVDDLNLFLNVLARPDVRDPLSRRVELDDDIQPLTRPLRVAWSPTLGGLPVEADITDTLAKLVPVMEGLGWAVTQDEPDFTGADEAFYTLRALLFASKELPAGADQPGAVKDTVQGEVDRGKALTSAEIRSAFDISAQLWQRAGAFFASYDILIGPVTQVSPFPVELEYPSEVAGQLVGHYLEWMLSNCRISAMALPALSLPAGFTSSGLPVGAQLIGRPWGDREVVRVAKALETALA